MAKFAKTIGIQNLARLLVMHDEQVLVTEGSGFSCDPEGVTVRLWYGPYMKVQRKRDWTWDTRFRRLQEELLDPKLRKVGTSSKVEGLGREYSLGIRLKFIRPIYAARLLAMELLLEPSDYDSIRTPEDIEKWFRRLTASESKLTTPDQRCVLWEESRNWFDWIRESVAEHKNMLRFRGFIVE